MIALVPLIAAILGVLVWVLSSNAVAKRIGEHLFWTGTLAFLFSMAGETVRFLK